MQLTLEQVARATGGRVTPTGADIPLNGISTDSRTIAPGELFVPLRGERFDGHDFLPRALQNGAAASLSEEVIAGLKIPLVQVGDTLQALGDIAMLYRRRLQGPLLAITGSSGKSTTKEMLAAILELTGPGLKTSGNFNNLIGLPLTLFGLRQEHEWAVLELGMSARGEIARLAEIAAPTIGIITNIGPAHLEELRGIEGVARAKGELFAALPNGGTAVFNADDERVKALPIANGVRRIGYGCNASAEIRANLIRSHAAGVSFRLNLPSGSYAVELAVPGAFHVYDALAAAGAAVALGVSGETICRGLATFRPLSGRMELVELEAGVLLLEDCYNANPLSMAAALQTLAGVSGEGRRLAILGDMLELGEASSELHRQVGRQAAVSCDLLVAFGPESAELVVGAEDGGLPSACICHAETAAEAADWVLNRLQQDDRLLIKGSRGMRLERVADQIKQAWRQQPIEGEV